MSDCAHRLSVFKKNTQYYTGTTLIELIISVAILGVILSIAVPGFSAYTSFHRIDSNLDVFVSSLKYTQSEAIKANATVSICIYKTATSCDTEGTPRWDQGWLIFVDKNGNGIFDVDANETKNDEILRSQNQIPLIILKSNISDDNTYQIKITFSSAGLITKLTSSMFFICDRNSENDCSDENQSDQVVGILTSGQIIIKKKV